MTVRTTASVSRALPPQTTKNIIKNRIDEAIHAVESQISDVNKKVIDDMCLLLAAFFLSIKY